jgi:hypothetical protein
MIFFVCFISLLFVIVIFFEVNPLFLMPKFVSTGLEKYWMVLGLWDIITKNHIAIIKLDLKKVNCKSIQRVLEDIQIVLKSSQLQQKVYFHGSAW